MIKLSDELHIPTMREIIRDRESPQPKKAARHYAAARVNRQNADWTSRPVSANYALHRDLARLRARARDLAANAGHFRKFLQMIRTNVIGPKGVQLQVRAMLGKKLHTTLNRRVEYAWWEWCFAENCSATGKLNWKAQQNLFVTHLARDGEVLVRKVEGGPFGLQLKFINVDYLDETYNDTLHSGNRVIMSVEIDANERPVAYWLTTPASDMNYTARRERTRTRVPAEEMIHAYLVLDDESAVRGVTWFHAAMLEGKNLEGYKHGVITSARATALSMGFITREADDVTEFTGEEDDEGNPRPIDINISPASFTELPPGYDVKAFDPKQPTQNHSGFVKSIEMDLASALGVAYFELSGDMESVNFSSARIGQGETRDLWRALQDFVGEEFCRPVYHAWLRSAMMAGKLDLTARDYEQVQNPLWRGRGWPYLEPMKDTQAAVLRIENKLSTFTDELAERGIDLTEHLETLQEEQELGATYGIDLSVASAAAAAATDESDGEGDSMSEFENVKQRADAYGVGVRAGVITPQTDDEVSFRQEMGLPALGTDASDAWKKDGGVRRPIALVSPDGSHPAAGPAEEEDPTDTASEDKPDEQADNKTPPKKDGQDRGYTNGHAEILN